MEKTKLYCHSTAYTEATGATGYHKRPAKKSHVNDIIVPPFVYEGLKYIPQKKLVFKIDNSEEFEGCFVAHNEELDQWAEGDTITKLKQNIYHWIAFLWKNYVESQEKMTAGAKHLRDLLTDYLKVESCH